MFYFTFSLRNITISYLFFFLCRYMILFFPSHLIEEFHFITNQYYKNIIIQTFFFPAEISNKYTFILQFKNHLITIRTLPNFITIRG